MSLLDLDRMSENDATKEQVVLRRRGEAERKYFVTASPEIVIQSDEDMQAFNQMYHERWANDHSKVIQEWRDMQAVKEEECSNA